MNKQNDVGGVEWRHTAQRVLAAWDSTVLPASRDGMMQERMEELRALLASPAAVGWIPVSERLPDAGKGVMAYYKNSAGYDRIVRAFYAPKHTLEANSYDDDGQFDHDEATDTSYLPEGWLEKIDNWGDFASIYIVEGKVTHWQPLPSPPAIASQEVGHDSAE